VPQAPAGQKAVFTYTTSITGAFNASGQPSGSTPPGLPLTETSPGAVTSL
jgi:hypothetical protein